MIAGGKTHPPTREIPRSDVAGGENQIATDKNAGTGPKRSVIVVVCADPNLANSAMRPDAEAVVDLMVKVALAVTRFQFAKNFCVLVFAAVFWRVLLGLGDSPTGTARGLIALGEFVAAAFDALFDDRWFDTALRFSGETMTLDQGRAAMILVDGMFRMFGSIARGFLYLVETWFGKNNWSGPLGSHFNFARLSPIESTLIVRKHRPVDEMWQKMFT
jgi:hypothetical protein